MFVLVLCHVPVLFFFGGEGVVVSGFCLFSLVYSWFCDRALTLPSYLVFWCSLVYVLCFMLECGVRIPALLSCFKLCSGFVSGFGDSRSRFGLAVGVCGLEFAWVVRASVHVHSLSSFFFLLFCLVLHLSCSNFHVCHVLCEHAAY